MDANISLSVLGVLMMSRLSVDSSFIVNEKKSLIENRGVENEQVVTPSLKNKNNIILVGEGGTSGNLFVRAAETYKKEHGGEIYYLSDGDDYVDAVKDFVAKNGHISHMEYFGHGNEKGLYINQLPNVHGGLYANDEEINKNYRAASIRETDSKIFESDGTIKINGCNAANGYPNKETIAQKFANYYDVEVVAATGPTEFDGNLGLEGGYGSVYMVPTNERLGFVEIAPQVKIEGFFEDVRKGQNFLGAVQGLTDMGLDLDFEYNEQMLFEPYKYVTYGEALNFCKIAVGDNGKCDLSGHGWDEKIRNLQALKMLVDAVGIGVDHTNPWYNGYINKASQIGGGILPEDFVYKKWITRGEMAELTWNLVVFRNIQENSPKF